MYVASNVVRLILVLCVGVSEAQEAKFALLIQPYGREEAFLMIYDVDLKVW